MAIFDGKLILTDLDGTLLNEESRISEENQAAIDWFMENGGLFSVATGRSKAGMEHFFPELRINAPAVLYNGSVVYDFASKQDIWTACVGQQGYRLAQALTAHFPQVGIEVYAEHRPYVAQDSAVTRRHFASVKMPWTQCPASDIPQPWLSLVVTGEEEQLPPVSAFIQTAFPGAFFVQYSSRHMLEVMHRDANKGVGASRLREHLGIAPRQLYTVGDGSNDIQLLQCTANGCAPENACPEILSIAARILPDNEHHTLAALIQQLSRGE